MSEGTKAEMGKPEMGAPQVDRAMLEALTCPLTQMPLRYDAAAGELISEAAGLAFPIRDGVPIMLASEARDLRAG